MYSRNTSRRGIYRQTEADVKIRDDPPSDEINNADDEKMKSNNNPKKEALPSPPPNYGGMIYDRNGAFYAPLSAEGIERLASNDELYSERLRNSRRGKDRHVFSHMDPPVGKNSREDGENGLSKLVEGLRNRTFQPEDILICSMIMLMLNSKSEDDILMILVLMMLL